MKKVPAVTVGMIISSTLAVVLSSMLFAQAPVSNPSASPPEVPAASHEGQSATSDLAANDEDLEVATFEFRPSVLNLESSGKYVTARLVLPDGRTVRDVVIPTVKLNGIVYASTSFGPHNLVVEYENKGTLMLKFDKEWVQEILSPGTDVPVWMVGSFADGTCFIAWGEVTITA